MDPSICTKWMTFPSFVDFFVQKHFPFSFHTFLVQPFLTNRTTCHKQTFIFFGITFVESFNKICQTHLHLLCPIYIYRNVLLFLGMVQICFVLNIPSGKFASHPFVGCRFWFYIKNTICCKQDCKYSTISVVGLMLYRHIYYLKSGRGAICFLKYGVSLDLEYLCP